MKTRLLLIILMLLPALAQEPTAPQLLDSVLENPGSWSQMCSLLTQDTPADEMSSGGFYRPFGDKISAENFRRLRARREEVIEEINKRLDSNRQRYVTILRTGNGDKKDADLEDYLLILIDLNAAESLPALLNLEGSLHEATSYSSKGKLFRETIYMRVLSTITAILKAEKYREIPSGKVSYDKKMRDTIVSLTKTYLNNTEPAEFRGAEGMTKEPIVR